LWNSRIVYAYFAQCASRRVMSNLIFSSIECRCHRHRCHR